MSSEQVKPEITTLIKEVNTVLEKHLSNLLNPILQETKITNNILLNIPYVKKLYDDNEKKTKIIRNLSKKLEMHGKGSLKLEVSEVDKIGTSFFKNNIELNVEKKNKKISTTNLLNYSSSESYTYSDDDDGEEYIQIGNKLTASPQITTILENLKKAQQNYVSPMTKQVNSFSLLEEEEDEEDEITNNTSFALGVLKAQNAGMYATIDTASEEEGEEEEEESDKQGKER